MGFRKTSRGADRVRTTFGSISGHRKHRSEVRRGIRGRVSGQTSGWWPGLGFVSTGFRKISRRVYSVRITIGGISNIGNIGSISE